jgi:hypothetical protein
MSSATPSSIGRILSSGGSSTQIRYIGFPSRLSSERLVFTERAAQEQLGSKAKIAASFTVQDENLVKTSDSCVHFRVAFLP